MKIFTNKQFDKLLDEIAKDTHERLKKARQESYEKGEREGYNKGLHEGLTTNKEGVVMNSTGLYVFKENECRATLSDRLQEVGIYLENNPIKKENENENN